MAELSHEEILRYSRHLLIPEVGMEGQRKLKAASILVIGTGGLGSPVALYLAAAGIGRIGIIDYDKVEYSNLQRQIIHGSSTLGKLKVESAKTRMMDVNPEIQIDTYNEVFTSENAMRIAGDYDVVIDCSDNFPTRYLSNDVCVLLGKPNIYGSIFRFEGQASVFYAKEGPCYRCLFPEPPPPNIVPTCAEGGVLGILPGTIGTIQATEAIKHVLGIGELLIGKLLIYNALDMTFEYVKLRKNSACKICGMHPEITELIDYDAFCGVPGREHVEENQEAILEISPRELADLLKRGENVELLDVREPHELEISMIEGSKNIPLGQLPSRLSELDSARYYVLICRSGVRSRRAMEILLGAGFNRIKNLTGGINAWAKEVDPSLAVY
ncbi:MAG: molybdopterin-synthase adenylyltransferase MoeB [Chloroflexi bacterium]|nr:molybdopterin-synthase adenylyltransferase MoeB [Chloroflexota bacterium]